MFLIYFCVQTPKGVIPLDNCSVTVLEEDPKKKKKGKAEFYFNIQVTGGRIFQLGAEEEQEMLDWVETIRAVAASMRQHRIDMDVAMRSHQEYNATRSEVDSSTARASPPAEAAAAEPASAETAGAANPEKSQQVEYTQKTIPVP
jgi:hypothetical protein